MINWNAQTASNERMIFATTYLSLRSDAQLIVMTKTRPLEVEAANQRVSDVMGFRAGT